MTKLSSYVNVYNTVLIMLKNKGYYVWTDENESNWFAEKDGWDFQADNPIELLGLISIYDYHKPQQFKEYWWRIEEPWLIESVPKKPK